ncbi:MAG: Dabb family protein [Burkholderiaceae bacterium]|jgi:hypothetical protein|nr:Dabb family protein [Burkholderiaceae bacterium]
MFHHVVLMKFTAAADPAFHAAVEAYCERVRAGDPPPQRYVYHRNIAPRSDGLDYAIVAAFKDSAEHDRYQVSATHLEMKAFMAPFIERLVACDIDEAMRMVTSG